MKVAIAVFLAVGLAALAAVAWPPLSALDQLPAVGPAYVDSFTVSCGATATAINAPSATGSGAVGPGAMISYTCQTPASAETGGTVLVAVGDSGIADPAFATRNSPVYSGDTIREWGGNAKKEYCRADTGTVTIFCRALVATAGAP